jgi:hypothetical protein
MNPRRATERIDFQPGIVGQHQFPCDGQTIRLGFFPRVFLEGGSVFDDLR